MKRQLRTSGFRGGFLPFRSFEEISDQLLREIELVDIEIPGGTMTRDRLQFTPIQEAYYQASQHIEHEEWPGALKALKKAIGLHPQPGFLSAMYTMIGMIHARTRNHAAAIQAFVEAIKLNDNSEFAHFFLGTALMLSNRYKEAVEPIRKALLLDPRLTHGNFYLGYVYTKLEKWDEAIKAYSAEIETHPKSAEAYQELGRLYFKLGDENVAEREFYYLKAIETFTQWVEITPEAADTRNLIGYLYMMIGKQDPAIDAFRRAVEVNQNHIPALFNLGTAYLETDRNQEAREVFDHIIQLGEPVMREQLAIIAPNVDATARLSLGEAYQKLGAACLKMYQSQVGSKSSALSLLSEAETAFKTSLKYAPSDTHSLYNLGITYYMMGCRVAAIREFRHVLEIEPNSEEAANNLRIVEEDLGKVRHWLGSRVWKRLESSTDQSPVYSEDLVDEIAEARAKMYENIPTSHEADAFTSEDLLQALLPLIPYIPSTEDIADLAVRIFQRGWLSSSQTAKLAGTDLAAFLAYLHLVGIPLDDLKGESEGADSEYADALVEALKEVLELNPDDERARVQLRALIKRRLDQRLQDSGLLKEVRPPITDFTPYEKRTHMPVSGKPLSEIVIENRR